MPTITSKHCLEGLPDSTSTLEEVANALHRTALHLQEGGQWDTWTRTFVNAWLDREYQLRRG